MSTILGFLKGAYGSPMDNSLPRTGGDGTSPMPHMTRSRMVTWASTPKTLVLGCLGESRGILTLVI
jgi:hypothetical protein